MPAAFEACRKAGGKIRTKALSGGRYLPICYKDGKSYPGYVKKSGMSEAAAKAASKRFRRG